MLRTMIADMFSGVAELQQVWHSDWIVDLWTVSVMFTYSVSIYILWSAEVELNELFVLDNPYKRDAVNRSNWRKLMKDII